MRGRIIGRVLAEPILELPQTEAGDS